MKIIMKERDPSLDYFRLEALHHRLYAHHQLKEKVQSACKRIQSGIRGEKEIDYPLQFLDQKKCLVLHNLRLSDPNGYFQIDTLLLSQNLLLILEVKNWYGTIIFGENGQVTRHGDHGVEEGFPNPVAQAKLQKHRLQKWLHGQGLTNIPLDFFIVISFPSTILKSSSPAHVIPKRVIHNNQLLFNINQLKNMYPSNQLTMETLLVLSQQLMKAHIPAATDVLAKYNIDKSELMRGVACPTCLSIPMKRWKQKWVCHSCGGISENAHLSALNDYKLLIGDEISNKQAREFLQINSPDVAKRLLQKAGFKSVGNTKGRVYMLDFTEDFIKR